MSPPPLTPPPGAGDEDGLAAQLAGLDEGAAGLADALLTPIRELVLGHRAALLAAGVDKFAADEMAADAHAYLTACLLRGEVDDPDEPQHVVDVAYEPRCSDCGAPVALDDDDQTWRHVQPGRR